MENAENRQQFSSKMGFLLSAVGSAVGLGNIWRYPYIAYRNGGGAFLVPYFIAVFTAGIPLLILEYTIGMKYRGSAPTSFARMKKKFEWVGWIPAIVCGFVIVYYPAVLSWASNYFLLSFTKGWGADPASFFYGNFLNISSGPLDIGGISIPILIGLVVVWAACYFVCSGKISSGIERANKVLIPLMVVSLLLIVIRGITLPGSAIGLNQLFTPDWSALAKPDVWIAAYGQVFFSLSLAFGIMITYASYLPKDTELVNTSFIAALSNSAFEFTAAIGVFSILGFMSAEQGIPFADVAAAGPGLTFVVFPQGINTIPGITGTLTGVLFFICLVAAGFTSFISLTEAFSAPFIEKYGMGRKKMYAITCIMGFVLSTLIATNAGIFILDIIDYVTNSYGLVITGILQAVVCCWILKKVPEYTEFNNKTAYIKLGTWWKVCITYILPIMCIFILLTALYGFLTAGYEGYGFYELLIYGGGTIAVVLAGSIYFTNAKWRTQLENYTE